MRWQSKIAYLPEFHDDANDNNGDNHFDADIIVPIMCGNCMKATTSLKNYAGLLHRAV